MREVRDKKEELMRQDTPLNVDGVGWSGGRGGALRYKIKQSETPGSIQSLARDKSDFGRLAFEGLAPSSSLCNLF